MTNIQKLVSVIIPSYNCGKFITRGVESVLKQTYRNFEILVIDDGSIDKTKDILMKNFESVIIKYFYQINKGPAAARNVGISSSFGKYIAFLDADDLWLENKLENSINFMESNNFDWMCTSMVKISENGEKFVKRIDDESWVLNSKTKEIKQLKNGLFFFSSIPVHTPTIVVRKKCFELAGIFDESFLIGEDTDLWLRFEEAGLRGGYLDEPLTIYNYNGNSLTKGKKIDGLHEHSKVAKKHALILGLNQPLIRQSYSEFLWAVADRYYSDKKYLRAFKYLILSVYFDISRVKKAMRRLCKL